MIFTLRILGASSYETRRANDTASILVLRSLLDWSPEKVEFFFGDQYGPLYIQAALLEFFFLEVLPVPFLLASKKDVGNTENICSQTSKS